jgi:L-fuconolactonase
MAFRTMDSARLRPWIETCLELFGVDRCFFGSNFPVDGLGGTYGELIDAYRELTAELSADERHRLFVVNALRRYRIE